MIISSFQNGILLTGEKFVSENIFDCGQCFRFIKNTDEYIGVAHNRILHVKELEEGVYIYPVKQEEYELWEYYFDLKRDYSEIERSFAKDSVLRKTLELAGGMRVLHQDPFETIITFIISANNNIGRIRKIIEKLCETCGKKLAEEHYAFPEPGELAKLSAQQLRELGLGYRAEYVVDTAAKIAAGYDLNHIYEMDYHTAKKELMTLKGVGPKVADCILLFAYGKDQAFPMDVWIKRMLKELYGFVPKNNEEAVKFAEKTFAGHAGIAQQYLFHYMRRKM